MNILKKLFCKHNYVFVRNSFVDEILMDEECYAIKRIFYELYRCSKCGKQKKIITSKEIL